MKLRLWTKNSKSKAPKPKKSLAREWGDAIMFAVVVATLVRWATFEAFAIPTSSMEKSLLVGDYLFVSKLHYGARTPITPLQVPLTHQKIWGTNIASYSKAIQLAPHRLFGFSEVQHNDAIVFNYPADEEHPVDLKTYYIKRCVGIAGDSVAIRKGQVYINGIEAKNPQEMQYSYLVSTDRVLNNNFFLDREITEVYPVQGGYIVNTSSEKIDKLHKLDFIKDTKLLQAKPGEAEAGVFPNKPAIYKWNKDNFGPLYVPKAGATVTITPQSLPLYKKVILEYEQNDKAEVQNGKLIIDGQEVKEYTFKQNYYFMMGDNRHNSLDSRYWGFVPEDHVVGKGVFVWMSVDSNGSWLDRVRWNRVFSKIE